MQKAWMVAGAGLAAGLGVAWLAQVSYRRYQTLVRCPHDHQPHLVEFSGSTLVPSRWLNVLNCEIPGEAPQNTGVCGKACLCDPFNSPRRQLARTSSK